MLARQPLAAVHACQLMASFTQAGSTVVASDVLLWDTGSNYRGHAARPSIVHLRVSMEALRRAARRRVYLASPLDGRLLGVSPAPWPANTGHTAGTANSLGSVNGTQAVFAFDANSALTIYPDLGAARQAVVSGVLAEPHTGIYTAEGVPVRWRGRELLLGDDEPKLLALQQRLAEYQRHLPVVPEEVDVATVWLAGKRG